MTAAHKAKCELLLQEVPAASSKSRRACGQILREWKLAIGSWAGWGIFVIKPCLQCTGILFSTVNAALHVKDRVGALSACRQPREFSCLTIKVLVHSWNMIQIASSMTLREGCGRVGVCCPHLLLTTPSHWLILPKEPEKESVSMVAPSLLLICNYSHPLVATGDWVQDSCGHKNEMMFGSHIKRYSVCI